MYFVPLPQLLPDPSDPCPPNLVLSPGSYNNRNKTNVTKSKTKTKKLKGGKKTEQNKMKQKAHETMLILCWPAPPGNGPGRDTTMDQRVTVGKGQ